MPRRGQVKDWRRDPDFSVIAVADALHMICCPTRERALKLSLLWHYRKEAKLKYDPEIFSLRFRQKYHGKWEPVAFVPDGKKSLKLRFMVRRI